MPGYRCIILLDAKIRFALLSFLCARCTKKQKLLDRGLSISRGKSPYEASRERDRMNNAPRSQGRPASRSTGGGGGGINYPTRIARKSWPKEPIKPSGFLCLGFNEGTRGAGAPERKNHITGRQLTAPFRAVSAINQKLPGELAAAAGCRHQTGRPPQVRSTTRARYGDDYERGGRDRNLGRQGATDGAPFRTLPRKSWNSRASSTVD